MKGAPPLLAHAGESHRREEQSAPADPVALPPASGAGPAIAPGQGIGADLLLGLLVLSGWLWLPLLRRAGRWPGRRRGAQRAK